MAAIKFTKGVDTFTFQTGRCFPMPSDPQEVNIATDYSEGGQLYAYNKGITEQLFTLKFENIGQTDHDNLADWIINTCVGPLNTFTFTDENSTDHTVRCMDKKNPLVEVANGVFSGTVTLRKEI